MANLELDPLAHSRAIHHAAALGFDYCAACVEVASDLDDLMLNTMPEFHKEVLLANYGEITVRMHQAYAAKFNELLADVRKCALPAPSP